MIGKQPKLETFDGITGSLAELRQHFKWYMMSLSALRWRLRQGMSIAEAIALPTWDWQRQHADLATKKLRDYESQRTSETRPATAKKPVHPPEISDHYFGICRSCGSILLKQSLQDGQCRGGC